MLRFALLFSLLLIGVTEAFSQAKLNELTVDRPGIAETPFTVSKGSYQFEFGFDYFKRQNREIYHLPALLFRTGIVSGVELRIATRHLLDNTDAESFRGVTPVSVGVKFHVIKQKKPLPEIDILTNMVFPVGETAARQNSGPEFLLLLQNDLGPKSALNYNAGFLWDHVRNKNYLTAVMCYNYLASEKVGLFIEYFSYYPEALSEQGVDAGLTYLLQDQVQLDLSAGVSHIEKGTNLFVSTGLSFRIE